MAEHSTLVHVLDTQEIPTLPSVILRILETSEDDSASADQLAALLEMDHAISARVLRVANSAFYGFPGRVDTLRRAVVLLGFDAVRLLSLAAAVVDVFSEAEQFALDPREFWLHAFGTAKASQLLAQRKRTRAPAETCFAAGLMHDLGKCVLAISFGSGYAEVLREAQTAQKRLADVEREFLGIDHCDAGAAVAERWQFPSTLVAAMQSIDEPSRYMGPHGDVVTTVSLGERLAKAAGFGLAGDAPPQADAAARLAEDLGPALADDLVELLAKHHIEAERLLDVLGEK